MHIIMYRMVRGMGRGGSEGCMTHRVCLEKIDADQLPLLPRRAEPTFRPTETSALRRAEPPTINSHIVMEKLWAPWGIEGSTFIDQLVSWQRASWGEGVEDLRQEITTV